MIETILVDVSSVVCYRIVNWRIERFRPGGPYGHKHMPFVLVDILNLFCSFLSPPNTLFHNLQKSLHF